ncbi:hypothetical protein PLEOSDRAFT_1065309 [Pleurotus ostreatus PC15]|uniref:Homologous-pairing protein 2 winged helix domain-containing protein n=1 Tax=Pleurotus ostreatus (strain PC15) TaxID=1137138 RepID=A0A067NLV6_PLEO1|nr:hypothetical protein PLEOSDRAFT_1065309 [Pleurotus ostreatus PC15]
MNRPFGAVDVAANLKGAVAKTVTQKLLVSLAEKGELVQKLYGKTTFFVANQANIASVPDEEIATLEAERKQVEEENSLKAAEAKALINELARLKSTPTNDELDTQIADTKAAIAKALARLQPLRGGATLVSADDIAQIDTEWVKWRAEWTRRRKIFTSASARLHSWTRRFWQLGTDALPPQDASALAEDLGIEFDTSEHQALERSHICTANPLKRKR